MEENKQNKLDVRSSMNIIFRMWGYVKEYRVRFYVGFLLGSTAPFYFRFLDSYMVQTFTGVCVGSDKSMLISTLIRVCILIIVGIIIYPISFGMIYTTYSKISGVIKKRIFDKALKLNISYIESEYSGELVTRVTSDFNDAIQLVAYPVVGQENPFAIVFTILAIGILIVVKNPMLGAVSLLLNIVSIFVLNKMVKPLTQKEKIAKEITGRASQSIVDSLSGTIVSRIFGLQKYLTKQYEDSTEEIYNNNLSLIRRKSLLMLVIDSQSFLSFTFVCAIGLYIYTKGLISLPDVIFISTLQMSITELIRQLSQKVSEMQKYIVGAKRLFEFFDAPEETEREDMIQPDTGCKDIISFVDVSFAYDKEKENLFEDFSLSVENGEKVGIVGGSGGGKSTLIKLLLEFAKTDSGVIKVYGNDIYKYSQRTLKKFYSYVPQDCYLFDGTIRENVAMGDSNASDDEILKALENAYLKDYVESLPDGLDTQIGERGSLLSGGQRQRIAIARAFLKNAPILLLDEATSALDSQSEEIVQRAINSLMKGRTSIVIAHRLSTIQNMDRIIVLEHGSIVEEGTHESLILKDSRYSQLYNMQYANS